MMTARSDAGTGSGLQVGSFFLLSDYLMEIVVAQPAADLHEPCQAQVDDETAQDGAGIGGQNAEDKTADEGGDAFAQGFAEVDGTIEGGHRKNGIPAGKAEKTNDEETAEEELDAEEVEAVRELIQQFPGPCGVGKAVDKGEVLDFGVDPQKIVLGRSQGDQRQQQQEQCEIRSGVEVEPCEAG